MLTEKIEELRSAFRAQLDAADAKESLDAVRVAFLGKKGPISELMKGLRDMTPEEKKNAGQFINAFKSVAEEETARSVGSAKSRSVSTPDARRLNSAISAS